MGPSASLDSLFIIFDFFIINIRRSIIRPRFYRGTRSHIKAINQVQYDNEENIFHAVTLPQRYTAGKNIPTLSRYSYEILGASRHCSPQWADEQWRDRVLSGFRPRDRRRRSSDPIAPLRPCRPLARGLRRALPKYFFLPFLV